MLQSKIILALLGNKMNKCMFGITYLILKFLSQFFMLCDCILSRDFEDYVSYFFYFSYSKIVTDITSYITIYNQIIQLEILLFTIKLYNWDFCIACILTH